MRGIAVVILAGLFVAAAWIGSAQAHVGLSTTEVRAGVDPTAGPELRLTFTGPLDQAFSKVQVLDARGKAMLPGPGSLDPGGPFLRTIPAEVTVGAGLLLVVGVLTSIAPV